MNQFKSQGWGHNVNTLPNNGAMQPNASFFNPPASTGTLPFMEGLGNFFAPTPMTKGANMYEAARTQRDNAWNKGAQPIDANAMAGGVGGIAPLSDAFGNWFKNQLQNAPANQPVSNGMGFPNSVGVPPQQSLGPNGFIVAGQSPLPSPMANPNSMSQPVGAPPASPYTGGAPQGMSSMFAPSAAPTGGMSSALNFGNSMSGVPQQPDWITQAQNPNQSLLTAGNTTQPNTGMFGDMTGKDMINGAWQGLTTGINAYGMFAQLGQADRGLDIAQGDLNVKKDSFDEMIRHRQALVGQNKSA